MRVVAVRNKRISYRVTARRVKMPQYLNATKKTGGWTNPETGNSWINPETGQPWSNPGT